MQQESQQKPKIRAEILIALIALAFTAASFGLGLLAYLRPPDPAHPASFDFLSRTISLPLWFAAVLVVAIVSITGFWTRRRKGLPTLPPPVAFSAGNKANPPWTVPERPQPVGHSPVSVPTSLLEGFAAQLELVSSDDFTLEVHQEEQGDTKGLILKVRNDSLRAIAKIAITIYSARSFDSRHQEFRHDIALSGVRVIQPDPIRASCTGRSTWLLAKQQAKTHLFAGDNTGNEMRWPDNDASEVQNWLLHIGVNAETVAQNSSEKVRPLAMIKTDVVVLWNKPENMFLIKKA